jgi:hypothetical protein
MFTSQLSEQEALNGPSLEKAAARYSAAHRTSIHSRANPFSRRFSVGGNLTRLDDVRGHFP